MAHASQDFFHARILAHHGELRDGVDGNPSSELERLYPIAPLKFAVGEKAFLAGGFSSPRFSKDAPERAAQQYAALHY